MIKFPATQSLLPWLDKKVSKIHLSIPFSTNCSHVPGKTSAWFMVHDASSAVANLIDASFALDSQNAIKKIFLLVQKDQYSFTEKHVPLDNKGIDHLWEETFEFYEADKTSTPFISLPGLTENEQSLPLWKSLFYCTKQECFFHPPCPVCGSLLELCTAENILAAADLPSYASSLERFLFCPKCHGSNEGRADFFVCNEAGAARSRVKDCRALIVDFGRLIEDGQPVAGFPCQTCGGRDECFRGERLASSWIVPFAFYPFRMLLSESMQLQARDFLSLISGAACDEIKNSIDAAGEPGRARCLDDFRGQEANRLTSFFADEPRRFLEVLYLKLAFLQQISGTALSGHGELIHPDLRPSLDHYWVNLADYEGLLPYFWNFKVRPRAVGLVPPRESSFVRVPQALSLHALAVLWFHALLTNSRQTEADIQRAIAPFLTDSNIADEGLDFGALAGQEGNKAFAPENIFWQPRAEDIQEDWLPLWQEALNLGWTLLRASYGSEGRFPVSSFMEQINKTAAEVKKSLFAANAASSTMAAEKQTDSEEPLSAILFNILEKWRAAPTPAEIDTSPAAAPEPQATGQPEEIEKTVIMNAEQVSALLAEQEAAAGADEPQEEKSSDTHGQTMEQGPLEEVEKTVIMNINDIQALATNQPPAPEPAAEVRNEPPPAPAAPQTAGVGEDDLAETVMISAAQLEELRNKAKKR
ncbi:MAG TPA: hypothetical protein ENK33_02040 [Desulfobacterales bacterium]|nr:hypothetical protein [Desulfobacterales bacterium]